MSMSSSGDAFATISLYCARHVRQLLRECDRTPNGGIGSHAGVGDRSAAEPIACRFMPKTRYAAGITSIDSNGAVIMPPTIGEAMRRMISDPVPLPHIMGSRPAIITATVMA